MFLLIYISAIYEAKIRGGIFASAPNSLIFKTVKCVRPWLSPIASDWLDGEGRGGGL